MIYDENVGYNDSNFDYSGIRSIFPTSIILSETIGILEILKVYLIKPTSILSELSVAALHKVIINTSIPVGNYSFIILEAIEDQYDSYSEVHAFSGNESTLSIEALHIQL